MKKIISLFLCLIYFSLISAESGLAQQSSKIKSDIAGKVEMNLQSPIDFIDVSKTEVPLSSRLNNQYTGYNFTITSRYPHTLYLTNGEVQNGVNAQQAYLTVEKGSGAVVGATLGSGFVLGFVSFGITFLVALAATPFIVVGNSHQNKKAKIESFGFSNQVPLGYINQGETIKLSSLIPIGTAPQIKITIQDPSTKQFYTLNR